MASLAFVGAAVAGGATSATVGGAIALAAASAAGAFIDNAFLFPALTPAGRASSQQNFQQRLGGLQIQSASEGSPMSFVLGPASRLAGQLIWLSDLIEVPTTTTTFGPHNGGGSLKGGTRSSQVTNTSYTYFLDIAIGLAQGELEGIDRIMANGQTIFQDQGSAAVNSSALRTEVFNVGSNKWIKVIDTPGSGVDLTVFTTGLTVDMTGWADSDLNDTWTIIDSGFSVSADEFFLTLAHSDSRQPIEAAGNTIDIDQNPNFFDDGTLEDVRFFPGDLDQVADSLIEATEGVGSVPAFRGTSYIVLEKLNISKFGNQLPQFSIVLREASSRTVGEAISAILVRAGLDTSQFDVTGLDEALLGFNASGPESAINLLTPILQAFNILVTDSNGVLTFIERGSQTVQLVDADDLAAGTDGNMERPFKIAESFDYDLPAEVNVKFTEPKTNYQVGDSRERINDFKNNTVAVIDLQAITMNSDFAREIARRVLWSTQLAKRTITLSLPPSYIFLEENDIIQVTFEDELYVVLISKIDRGYDGVIVINGQIEYVDVNIQDGEEDLLNPTDTDRSIFIGGPFFFEIIDIAPFTDNHNTLPGVYLAVALVDSNAEFEGASVVKSSDGQTFTANGVFNAETEMGFVEALSPGGPTNIIDRGSVIQVTMVQGTLESITEEEMLNGGNLAILGDEVIQFQTAVLVATNVYDISILLRGLRNTEDEVDNHSALDERFILMSGAGPQFFQLPIEDIGEDRFYKAVPPGVAEGTLPALGLQPVGANTVRAFSPSLITGVRDDDGNLTIRWFRRSRAQTRHFVDNLKVPLVDSRERYQIDFLNLAATAIVRTVEIEGPFDIAGIVNHTYTDAEQIEDGLSPGADVNLIIFQMSEIRGRGNPEGVTV